MGVIVQVTGPEFTQPTLALMMNVGAGSISVLQVYPGSGAPQVQTLPPALSMLKKYFAPSGVVVLYLNASQAPAALLQQLQSAAERPVTLGSQGTETLASQIAADSQRQQMERWKIMQGTQIKMFEIQQDVTTNLPHTAPKTEDRFPGSVFGQ
jgi:hypothetical protein